MNKKWIAFLTAGVIAFSCMTAQAEEPARRSITVTGTSEVTAKSDMATVNVSVETSSPNVKAAVREKCQCHDIGQKCSHCCRRRCIKD